MSSELKETFKEGISTLTLNRPHARNAMTLEIVEALEEALPRLANDNKTRCVVLTGAGEAFCAGGDVKAFAAAADKNANQTPKKSNESNRDDSTQDDSKPSHHFNKKVAGLRQRMEISRLLHEMPKPTLAIMPGAAAGAGLSLALACDFRFALDTAKLTTAFSKIAVSGDYGGSYFLSQLVGAAKARELYFCADVISGQQAFELGIVTKVANSDNFAEQSLQFAQDLASLPTVAVGYMKKNLNAALPNSLAEVFDLEALHMIHCFSSDDHKEAAKAFVEKRKVSFTGN